MNSVDNKSIALEFLKRLANKDATGALTLMSEDAHWWMPPGLPGGGGHGAPKERTFRNISHLFDLVEGPFRQDVIGVTAEGNRVAVEVEGGGRLRDGAIYTMNYHFLFIIRDGLISSVKEYCDTAMTLRHWRTLTGQPPPVPGDPV